ncbi:DUF1501 domain-containing protein [Limnobacter humi]|uniref:DUF1501 domain-containing protein n=1 Tax=Limnobacter humi TaxID=1778671 RepID=A0ABT1WH71_9BURK|nr:DUF1501 domain-containing protein [Limnobacter humi]MCQ8896861.1 DUF1501 domain-containing protein [Limnobacter humi]
MKLNQSESISRRAFLKRTAQLSATGLASPFLMTLAGMGEAAAATCTNGDYKALVCVFLHGGNDHANTLIPVDNVFYSKYQSIRPSVAIAQDALSSTTLNPSQSLPGGMRLALAPQMQALMPLFQMGRLGIQLNVGPLIEPTNLDTYTKRTVRLPPKLFSHNDQSSLWQSNMAEGGIAGWGGKMGDLMLSTNGGSSFTCISVSGNAVFLSGEKAISYQITPNGSIPIGPLDNISSSKACGQLLQKLITSGSSNYLEAYLNTVTSRSIAASGVFAGAFNPVNISTAFESGSSLASQLKAVARTIAGRATLGVKRQVFFVSLGGFDTHDNLKATHPELLRKLANALASFYEATVELGVADQVTTFTASDFGRTLATNGDGSDHGWGGHHFVLGGAVNGGGFYGQAADISRKDEQNIDGGRLIPTTSVDHMIANIAQWFGVSSDIIPLLAPHLKNFGGVGPSYFRCT